MSGTIHLVKLCVGAEQVEDLITWQESRRKLRRDGCPVHVTRMWPKRDAELLNGGSLYWVFKGAILARQQVRALEETIGDDGIRRCAIVLDPEVVLTTSAPKRPFQGWRYLIEADAPRDLPKQRKGDDSLPPELSAALADLGLH